MKDLLKKYGTKEVWRHVEQKYFESVDHSLNFISLHDADEILSDSDPSDVVLFAGAAGWRYTQGIYDIDATLSEALTETEISDSIPADVLRRLPEWTVFVRAENLKFFCFHETDVLWFCIHGQNEFYSASWMPIPFQTTDSIEKGLEALRKNAKEGDYKHVYSLIKKCISLLLYICSSEPDTYPELPQISNTHIETKTKKGLRIFAPDKERIYHIGQRIGEKIRQSQAGNGSTSSKAAHIRRAHWHGYWVGEGRSKFIFKWLAPVFVGGGE